MSSIYAAGNTIDALCSRCHAVRQHTIVAMIGDEVAKVRCDSCMGEHRFRSVLLKEDEILELQSPSSKSRKKAAASPRAPRTSAAQIKQERNWQEAVSSRDASDAIVYSMTESFKAQDLISHPIFGLGVVLKNIQGKKLQVSFKDGIKALRCSPKEDATPIS